MIIVGIDAISGPDGNALLGKVQQLADKLRGNNRKSCLYVEFVIIFQHFRRDCCGEYITSFDRSCNSNGFRL